MSTLITLVFVLLMAAAMVTDAITERLPNRLTVLAVAAGLTLRIPLGPEAVLLGLAGVVVALFVGIPLFAVGAIGGGDVKLMGAVGAFMGPTNLLGALLVAGALGLLLALAVAIARGVILPALVNTRALLIYGLSLGRRGSRPSLGRPGAIAVPYGVAIAGGALVAWFIPVWEVLT